MPSTSSHNKSKVKEGYMGLNTHNHAYYGVYEKASKSKSREKQRSIDASIHSNEEKMKPPFSPAALIDNKQKLEVKKPSRIRNN